VVLTSEVGRMVVTGNHAITIVDDSERGGSYRATAWFREAALWSATMSWPVDHDGVPSPPDDTGGWKVGAEIRLDDGSRWTVAELAS
jgi:hypothetical protein